MIPAENRHVSAVPDNTAVRMSCPLKGSSTHFVEILYPWRSFFLCHKARDRESHPLFQKTCRLRLAQSDVLDQTAVTIRQPFSCIKGILTQFSPFRSGKLSCFWRADSLYIGGFILLE